MQQQEFLNCFASYQSMSKLVRAYSYREILEVVASLTNSTPEVLEKYPVEGSDGMTGSRYGSVLRELQKSIDQCDWLYIRLEDDASRNVFANLIGYRMFPDPSFLEAACDIGHAQYFENDLASCGREVLINCREDGTSSLFSEKKHIRDDFPKLTIGIRNLAADLWKIPRLLDSIRPGYRLFLHTHASKADSFLCDSVSGSDWETVLYALPPKQRRKVLSKRGKRIVAMPIAEGWSNAQLVKDCGVVPYLLYKNHSCDVSMAGAGIEDYSNLKFVQGLKMDFLPDGTLQSKREYLIRESDKIDGLILYGAYPEYEPLADLYKRLNPEGRIYLALDANSFWMDRIQWAEQGFCRLLDQCDVIGASGRAMQRHLNEKWPWIIEYLPNGFYNFTGIDMDFSYMHKKNVILTVGRLGTKQKATNVLLEAFAAIADQIPDWNLHLAGTIEEEWKDNYLKRFWERFPELKERICFLGQISDREELYQEYLSAKVFALSSDYEGGCPNVIAEALYAGDAIAITKIDEYRDAIDNGGCGLAAECGDVKSFADILLQLCRNEDLEKLCRRAHEYAKEAFDMEWIVDRLNYLMFGEE